MKRNQKMDKERLKQQKKQWYYRNREILLEKGKIYYAKRKETIRGYQEIYRIENKEWISEKQKSKRTNRREEAIKFLGGKCSICNNVFDNCCYDFHHIDPTTKLFGISANKTIAKKAYWEEVSKCILLCANCHRSLHHGKGI